MPWQSADLVLLGLTPNMQYIADDEHKFNFYIDLISPHYKPNEVS